MKYFGIREKLCYGDQYPTLPIRTLIPLGDTYGAFGRNQFVVRVEMTTPIRQRELRYDGKIIIQLAPSMGESRAYDFCVAAEGTWRLDSAGGNTDRREPKSTSAPARI